MPIRRRLTVPPKSRSLETWYSSDDAKRSLGWLCQTVNEKGERVGLLGTADDPWLYLEDVDFCGVEPIHEQMTIEDVRANWSAVTVAAAVFGTVFQLNGKKPRAVLYVNAQAQHPALRYRHASRADVERIADQLDELTKEIRKLRRANPGTLNDLALIADRLDASSDLIDRRFTQLWRVSNGHSAALPLRIGPAH